MLEAAIILPCASHVPISNANSNAQILLAPSSGILNLIDSLLLTHSSDVVSGAVFSR
jgi:hypothetical protein